MTTESKSVCELYRMWAKGNYAVITLDSWENRERGTFGGVILVHSSVGNFGGVVSSYDVPFKQFLRGVDVKGFLTKCGGQAHMSFDGSASVRKLSAEILALRRARQLSAESACELWGDIQFSQDTACNSELGFRSTAARLCHAAPALGSPAGHVVHALSPRAKFFWEELWPEFMAILCDASPAPQQLAA